MNFVLWDKGRDKLYMNEKNEAKVNWAKAELDKKGIIFRELANGQLQVDTVNFWATSGKWYDTKTGAKGNGINEFTSFLSSRINTETIIVESDIKEQDTSIDDSELPW